MDSAQYRHDISDHMWELLEPHLPGRKGTWGGKARDESAIHQRHILDFTNRRAVAGFTTIVWRWMSRITNG
jgi:transposase